MRRLVLGAIGLAMLAAACTNDAGDMVAASVGSMAVGEEAPAFPQAIEWLNAAEPVLGGDLSGNVTLVHFWRSSCLSCLGTVPEIAALRAEFGDDLRIIGVHSPKFPYETDSDVARHAVQDVQYPGLVVNDPDLEVWGEWGIQAWPTTAVVDHAGNLAGGHVGLGAAEALQPLVEGLVAAATSVGQATSVVPISLADPAPTVLSRPEGVLADVTGNRLFISDTGHHRIVVATLDTHEVLAVVGDGSSGNRDGPAAGASFASPRGMALDGSTLYVADTGSHTVRAVDLTSLEVTTVAGTGTRGVRLTGAEPALEAALNVPWDLALSGDGLLITLAGANQLAILDIGTGLVRPFADTGEVTFAAATGIDVDATGVGYVADAESSSIKRVAADGSVEYLAGGTESLFEFGDRDGIGAKARLQWPLGIAVGHDAVWVADTYNSKIKRIDPATGEVETLVGGEGWRDGRAPLFSAPADIDFVDGVLYVTDRGNHSVRIVDTISGATSTVILDGIEKLVPVAAQFDGTLVVLDTVQIGAGPGTVVLDVAFPAGYKANELAQSRFEWIAEGDAVLMPGDSDLSLPGPTFPMHFEFTFSPGEGRLQGDVWLVYCESDTASICLFDRARIEIPLQVSEEGPATVAVAYEVTLPDGL